MRLIESIGFLFLVTGVGGQDLVATPGVTAAPGHIDLDLELPRTAHACIFVSLHGAGGKRRLAGVGGAWKLQGALAYAGVHRGGQRVPFPVPAFVTGTHVWFQALVVDGPRARFSSVARSTVATVAIDRRTPPRLPQRLDQVGVGQHVGLRARVEPNDAASMAAYTWHVAGPHVRDYADKMTTEWATTPMSAADYRRQSIDFYWRPAPSQIHPRNAGPVARRVRVEIRIGSRVLAAQRVYQVERNTSSARLQAEDWFCEYNHPESSGLGIPPTVVLNQHADWHRRHDWYLWPPCGPQVRRYAEFLHHHGHMIELMQHWRAFFGYAPLVEWDPATRIPGGIELAHTGRKTSDPKYPLPSYLTEKGGTLLSPCFKHRKLAEFKDLGELSPESAEPWHNGVHWAVGGDMGSTRTSPKDPVFWRFHLFIENRIHQLWHKLRTKK